MKVYNEEDFFYIDKRKYLAIFSIISIIYSFMIFFLKDNYKILNTVFTAVFLSFSLCILLLIKATYKLYKGKILLFLFIIHFYTAIHSFFQLLPASQCVSRYFNVQEIKYVSFILLNLIVIYLISRYSFSNKVTYFKIFANIIFMIICIIFIEVYLPKFYLEFYVILFTITYFIATQINLVKFRLFNINNINYIKLFSIVSIFMTVLYIATFFLLSIRGEIIFLCTLLNLIMFLTQSIIIIQKLLTNPYIILFDDLIKSNKYLEYTNEKILIRNSQLENSQMLIRKKERILKTFFINVPIPLIILDKNNNRIRFVNKCFMDVMHKTDIKEIINRKLTSIINIEDSTFHISEKIYDFIRCTIDVDGKTMYFDMEFINSSNNSDEIIVIFYDITSSVKFDTITQMVYNKNLEERVKREFLSNISHDLKTPINVIYSASQLVNYHIEEQNYEFINKYNIISKQNCVTLIRLTNNLIDSSKIYSGYLSANLKIKNIVQVIEDIVLSLAAYADGKEVELIFDTNEEEIFIEIDEEFMQRIILNLISNALKFTDKHGKIEVIVNNSYNKVSVLVRDNGKGMEREFLDSIFNKYSMGENNKEISEKGTGIGLFVVKKLVEEQNGSISVYSEPNKGTSFEMVFKKVTEYAV